MLLLFYHFTTDGFLSVMTLWTGFGGSYIKYDSFCFSLDSEIPSFVSGV